MPDRDLAARRLLAVTEEELQRIVLDIHDGPVQNLFAALSQLTVLRTRLAMQPSSVECTAAINRVIGLLEKSLGEIRDLLGTFRAPEFGDLSLSDMLEDLAVQHETLSSGAVTLNITSILPTVSLPIKIAVYRIIQEALSNIQRHAGVNAATVRAWASDNRLYLEVSDQGRGFEPPPLAGAQATERHEHIGLRGMRERASLINGELTVESHIGAGTRVRVEIPLDGT